MIRRTFTLLAVCLMAMTVAAQNWPKPSPFPNTPVTCPAGSPCAGRSIAPYNAPLGYVGRWLDSTGCGDNGQPVPRIRRARTIRIDTARDLLWEIQGGSLLAVYQLSSFVPRIVAGEALLAGAPRGMPPCSERFLALLATWNAMRGEDPGFNNHAQDQLNDVDFDDRGHVYVARDPQSWVVLRYSASAGIEIVHQDWPQTFAPSRMIVMRSGNRYYLAAGDPGAAVLYDVTNPAAPAKVRDLPGFDEWAKTSDRVAMVSGGRLLIYTAAALASGGAPQVVTGTGAYVSVTTSGDRFVAVARNGQDPVRVRFDAGAEVELGLRYLAGPKIRCNADYCAVFGYEAFVPGTDSAAAFNLRLFRLAGSSLVAVPLLSGARQAVASLYSAPYAGGGGWAGPTATGDGSGAAGADVRFVTYGGRTVMLAAFNGLGDAWYIDGAAPAPVPAPTPQPAPQPPPAPAPPSTPPPASACPAGFQVTCVPIAAPQPQPPPPAPVPVPQPPAPQPQPAPAPRPAPSCPCSRAHPECC